MSSNRVTVPPGWYAAGVYRQERWWDGDAWTAHVRSAPRPPIVFGRNGPLSLALGIVGLVVSLPLFVVSLAIVTSGTSANAVRGFGVFIIALAFFVLGAVGIWNFIGLRMLEVQALAAAPEARPNP